MFNRIFGVDPKLEFRRVGINLLPGVTISPNDSYWVQYWLLFDSTSEVVTLIDSNIILLTLNQNPTNLITLIQVLCNHLFTLLASPTFPGSNSINWNPTGDNLDLTKEALNCIRVLSRVLPFVLQNQTDSDNNTLEETIFWTKERIELTKVVTPVEVVSEASQFVIDDDEEDDEENGSASTLPQVEEPRYEELPPLAERLLSALVDLCFVAGFTVPEECRGNDGAINYVIWEPGIASLDSNAPPTSQYLLSNRLEIIRLINILLSLPSLLTPPQAFPTLPNRWRDSLVSGGSKTLDKKIVLCLLCSILNTALSSGKTVAVQNSSSNSVISGLAGGLGGALGVASGAAEKIGGVVLRREDAKGLLISSCIQLLAVFFIEHAPSENQIPPPILIDQRRPSTSTLLSHSNLFAYYLSKLHRASDFDFLISGILSLLSPPSVALLPVVGVPFPPLGNNTNNSNGINSKTGLITETLVVFWRMLELNGKFLNYILETDRGGEIMVLLMTFCLEFKDDDTQLGLVRLSAFLMQTLSAEKSLSSKLNVPVDIKLSLRGKYNVPGSIADFLIVSFYTLVFTTKARLSSLYPAFMLTITNCSMYFKDLSVVSSTRLLQLFLAFSAPSFLLMEEGNPRLVYYLLETFNNIIHYQLTSNSNLIYSLIRSSKRFEDLSNFTLSVGVAEVRKQRLEKKLAATTNTSRAGSSSIPNSQNVSALNSPRVSMSNLSRSVSKESEGNEKVSDVVGEGGEETEELSEKAKGKLRQTDTSSTLEELPLTTELANLRVEELERSDSTEVVDSNTPFVGKNGFIPTEGWVSSWRDGLPLDTLLILISEVRPEVLSLSASSPSTTTSNSPSGVIKSYLQSLSLSALLPPSPPIHTRKFQTSPQSQTWLGSLCYGSIYLTSLELLRDVNVQLFGIERAETKVGLNLNLGLRRAGESSLEIVGGITNFVLKKVGI